MAYFFSFVWTDSANGTNGLITSMLGLQKNGRLKKEKQFFNYYNYFNDFNSLANIMNISI
jgi:hypothetical protein